MDSIIISFKNEDLPCHITEKSDIGRNKSKVKLKNRESYVLKNLFIHGDSLTGIKWKNDTLTFAFNDMQETSVREFHLEGTILGLTVSAVAAAFLIIWAATHTSVW